MAELPVTPDPERQGTIAEQTTTIIRSHSGPLPSPEILAGFEQVVPGLADRIATMAEKEQDHRHRIENHEIIGRYMGQAGALVVLLALLSCIAFCAYVGHPLAAGIIAAVGAIVIAFLRHSTSRQIVEPEEKVSPDQPDRKKRRK
jgi:uncharacterized membrane protein